MAIMAKLSNGCKSQNLIVQLLNPRLETSTVHRQIHLFTPIVAKFEHNG
jgi:hypothetical protein